MALHTAQQAVRTRGAHLRPRTGASRLPSSIVSPLVVDLGDTQAAHVHVGGGKGANLHVLHHLQQPAPTCEILCWQVPETAIIPVVAYRAIVLGDKKTRKLIEHLEDLSCRYRKVALDDEALLRCIRKTSAAIRRRIEHCSLPDELTAAIDHQSRQLGALAVRSSADVEDLDGYAAAGLASSFLNVVGTDSAVTCVKKVWASLFADGFVRSRIDHGYSHVTVSMAVLLQRLIPDVKAAGAVTSIHPSGRPGYTITAQPGLGENVVQGIDAVDYWFIGSKVDIILEQSIASKASKLVPSPSGGLALRPIESDPAYNGWRNLDTQMAENKVEYRSCENDTLPSSKLRSWKRS